MRDKWTKSDDFFDVFKLTWQNLLPFYRSEISHELGGC